jgi:hypothetical protein
MSAQPCLASQLPGGNILLQRVSLFMFAALTSCRRSYGDPQAGFECSCLYHHHHIVIDEGRQTSIVPLPIESVALLEEVAESLCSKQFFTRIECDRFLQNERKMARHNKQTESERRQRLRSTFYSLINPIVINAIRPD